MAHGIGNIKKNIFFSLIILLIFLLLGEGTARIIIKYIDPNFRFGQRLMYSVNGMDVLQGDDQLGWTFRKNLEIKRRGLKISINSEGLRDREFSIEKEKDVERIIVLGDSIPSSFLVKAPFPLFLERYLNQDEDKKYEVMNAAIIDYDIVQEFTLLKERLLKYKPDIVLLSYYMNDARYFAAPRTNFRNHGAVSLLKKSAFVKLINRIILKYSVQMKYIEWKNGRFRWKDEYKKREWMHNRSAVDKLIDLADKDWGLAWTRKGMDESLLYISEFKKLGEQYNFDLIVVCLPVEMQLYAQGGNKFDIMKPQKEIKTFCRRNKIAFLSIIDELKNYKSKNLFHDHCHYTQLGHKYVAEAIANFILKG